MVEKRYGAGQGNPDGWTLQEIKDGWEGMQVRHVALCCFDDLIKDVEQLQQDLKTAKNFIGQYVNLPGHEHAAFGALAAISSDNQGGEDG